MLFSSFFGALSWCSSETTAADDSWLSCSFAMFTSEDIWILASCGYLPTNSALISSNFWIKTGISMKLVINSESISLFAIRAYSVRSIGWTLILYDVRGWLNPYVLSSAERSLLYSVCIALISLTSCFMFSFTLSRMISAYNNPLCTAASATACASSSMLSTT